MLFKPLFGYIDSYEKKLDMLMIFKLSPLMNDSGERRIRVHTMCLPVSNQMTEIIAGADQQGIMGLLTRMGKV